MSTRSLTCQKRVFKRYHSDKHFSQFYLQDGGKNQLERNYATVTLSIRKRGQQKRVSWCVIRRQTVSDCARFPQTVSRLHSHRTTRRRHNQFCRVWSGSVNRALLAVLQTPPLHQVTSYPVRHSESVAPFPVRDQNRK